jgi:glycosyltransferase involved in cell wall biosynthesis
MRWDTAMGTGTREKIEKTKSSISPEQAEVHAIDFFRMNTKPTVSVCMSTYRHEQFIKQAIEGVMMQQTTFRVELVIGEDCSDDRTRSICAAMEQKYSGRIRLLSSDRNYGQNRNLVRTLLACNGTYIALCEGDDCWTDPMKLQKQVEFLQEHRSYVLCFHSAHVIDENGNMLQKREPSGKITSYTGEQLYHTFVPTLALLFRNCLRYFPPEFFLVKSTDAFIVAMLATFGTGADLGFTCYRMHSGGLYNRLSQLEKYKQSIHSRKFMKESDFFNSKHKKEIRRELRFRLKLYVKIFLKKGQMFNCVRMIFFYLSVR